MFGRNVLALMLTTLALGGAFAAKRFASGSPQILAQAHAQVDPVAAPAPAPAMASQPLEIATAAQPMPILDLSEPEFRERGSAPRSPVLTAVPDFVPPAGVASSPERSLIRERFARVDLGALMPTFDAESPDPQPDYKTVALDLFEDVQLEVVLDRLDAVSSLPESLIWLGHVQGVEGSDVTLVVRGQVVQGVVHLPTGEQYELSYAGSGVHRIAQTDIHGFPAEAAPLDGRLWEDSTEPAVKTRAAPLEGLTVVDLMVVYTPKSRIGAGAVDAIEARIEQGVSMANQAYETSGVGQVHRLVHMAEVEYTESSSSRAGLALANVRNRNDGILEEVHELRNTYGADVVSFLIEDTAVCGLGYILDPRFSWAESYAFNVTYWACVGSTHSLAHEIGHNQGLDHDIDHTSNGSSGAFDYSVGLQDPTHFRTIMAYPWGCALPCPHINQFSNPAVGYGGRPTGVAGEADNAMSLSQTQTFVAAFRESVDGTDPDPGVDSDSDGMPDDLDNCTETANSDQIDTDLDGLGNACDADYNGDMRVNLEDLSIFRRTFLREKGDPQFNPAADSDGVVGNLDFVLLRRQFGSSPGPSGLACAGEPFCQGS